MKRAPVYDLHMAAGLYAGEDANTGIRPLAEIERLYIEEAISLCGGNIPRAAQALRISPSTIYRKQAQWKNFS